MAQQSFAFTKRFNSSILRSLLITIGVNVVLPFVIYRLASVHLSMLSALLLAGIPPAAATVLDLGRSGRLNLLGVCSLLAITLNLLVGFVFKDARLLLISSSLTPGVYGVIMLASVVVGKPILLTLIRSTLASTPPIERERLERRWLANGTSSFLFITTLWGVGLLSIPVISITLIYALTPQKFAPMSQIVQYAIFGTLLLVSHIYSIIRHVTKKHAASPEHGVMRNSWSYHPEQ